MKHIFLHIILLFSITSFAGTIVVEGRYQNQNIYVNNGYSNTGVGFCTYQVVVNGNVSIDEINSNAFEIDLTQYNFQIGAPVEIHINYKNDGCVPKVLNTFALKPNPTFETIDIHVDNNGVLNWTTINESAPLDFEIEQFKWNKWVHVGKVSGKGTPETHNYSFKTIPISGQNKFRVKQKGYIDKIKYSPSVSYSSLQKEVNYIYTKKTQTLDFSEETFFEVYNKYGELLKKGYGKKVNVDNLTKDTYYLNYGNSSSEFKKK